MTMTSNAYARLPDWDLPPEHLRARRAHLVREIGDESRDASIRPRRRRLAIVALVGTALLTMPTLALSGRLGLFDLRAYVSGNDDGPHASVIDLSQARSLVSMTLSSGQALTVWQAPTTSGGQCTFTHYSEPAAVSTRPTAIDGSAECSDSAPSQSWSPGRPLSTGIEWNRGPGGLYDVLVEGRVNPLSGIAHVDLRSASGSTRLAFANDHFLGELPRTSAAGQLPDGGPYVLVAYDGAGSAVATQDIQAAIDQARPK
jgi:hypothetical protein